MGKRLQVTLDDTEFRAVQRAARGEGLTVADWVREALRAARRGLFETDVARKRAAVRAATRHSFPTADIQQMLAEIEQGSTGRHP